MRILYRKITKCGNKICDETLMNWKQWHRISFWNIELILVLFFQEVEITWCSYSRSSSYLFRFASVGLKHLVVVWMIWATRHSLNKHFQFKSFLHIFSCFCRCVGKKNHFLPMANSMVFFNINYLPSSRKEYNCHFIFSKSLKN